MAEKTNGSFLEVRDLTVYYTVARVDTKAVNGVSFSLERGKTLGLVGETGSREAIFDHPTHPYTIGLFGAIPELDSEEEWLHPIDGLPPDPTRLPEGCAFSPRCPNATEECRIEKIPNRELAPGHFCRCLKTEKEA